MKRCYSPKDFTDKYPPGKTKLYEMLADGTLPRIKVGSRTFIPVEAAESWYNNLLIDAEKRAEAKRKTNAIVSAAGHE